MFDSTRYGDQWRVIREHEYVVFLSIVEKLRSMRPEWRVPATLKAFTTFTCYKVYRRKENILNSSVQGQLLISSGFLCLYKDYAINAFVMLPKSVP